MFELILFYMFIIGGVISFILALFNMLGNYFKKENLFKNCFVFIGIGVFLTMFGYFIY